MMVFSVFWDNGPNFHFQVFADPALPKHDTILTKGKLKANQQQSKTPNPAKDAGYMTPRRVIDVGKQQLEASKALSKGRPGSQDSLQ